MIVVCGGLVANCAPQRRQDDVDEPVEVRKFENQPSDGGGYNFE